MAEETKANEQPKPTTNNEVALEMMKFIAVSTGYGKGSSGTGFNTGKGSRTPEEQAEALIELYQRCRKAVVAG